MFAESVCVSFFFPQWLQENLHHFVYWWRCFGNTHLQEWIHKLIKKNDSRKHRNLGSLNKNFWQTFGRLGASKNLGGCCWGYLQMTKDLAMVGYKANINQLKDHWKSLRFKVPFWVRGEWLHKWLEVWVGGTVILFFFWGGERGTLLW